MSAQFISECATALRFAMFGTRGKPIEANELAAKATRFVINGRPMRIVWDIEHDVRDADGKSVLGVCEHDPDEPDAVMISSDDQHQRASSGLPPRDIALDRGA